MPTAVEFIANLGAVLVHLPQTSAIHVSSQPTLGGRSSVADQAESQLIGLLLPAVQKISGALHQALPANQKTVDVFGIGTTPATLNVLIALLRKAGFSASIGSCDGSVRPGFSGPTAVLRGHGGSVAPLFLQQVASSHAAMPYN